MPTVRPSGRHLTIPRSSHRSQRPFAVKLRQRGISPVFTQTLTGSRTTLPTLVFFLAAGASGLPSPGTEAVTMSALALLLKPLLNMIVGSILSVAAFPV